MLLAFVANLSGENVQQVTVHFPESVTRAVDAATQEEIGFTLDLGKFGSRILCVV